MTGPSVLTPTRVRRPGAATRESTTIRVRLAPISERVIARKAMRASSHTAFSSAGSTQRAIVRSRVRTARAVSEGFVSSRTRQSS